MLAVRATVSEKSCPSRAPSFAALPGTPEKGLGEGVAAVICLLSVSIIPWASLSLDGMLADMFSPYLCGAQEVPTIGPRPEGTHAMPRASAQTS